MINTLYVNGCSWTLGNELDQDPEFDTFIDELGLYKEDPTDYYNWNLLDKNTHKQVAVNNEFFNEFNWGKKFANLFGIKNYINNAAGGGSNDRIVRTTLEYVNNLSTKERSEVLIIIGWTNADRKEKFVKGNWHRWNSTQSFSDTVDRLVFKDESHISALEKLQQQEIIYATEEYASITNYFQNVFLLANTLENLGISYFFFNALPPWWTGGHLKTSIDVEQEFTKYIEWHETNEHILGINDSMYSFMHENNFQMAKYFHPLVPGHAAWATHLVQVLETRGLI